MLKSTRRYALIAAVLGIGFALLPVRGETIHRIGFGGKHTVLVRGDANVKVEEKEHDISDQSFKSQPTSEHLKLTADLAPGDAAFIHYHYDTPPAPITAALTAGVWVKATRPGVQLRARVVFPKEPDPARPESPLTMLIVGESYEKARTWQKLTISDVPGLVGKHLPVLQTKIGRAVNRSGAYIDRLVLNLYTGPGTADIWIDDLDIGPVKKLEAAHGGTPGLPTKYAKVDDVTRGPNGRLAEVRLGQLHLENQPFLFRAVRHTGVPLHVLRQAGFDALWVPADVPNSVLEEAKREGLLIIPTAPLAPSPTIIDKVTTLAAETALDSYVRKFAGSDVLFWDMGGGRQAEQVDAVERTSKYVRKFDAKRPFSADVWDGFQGYSSFLDAVGAHRWPLFTSLELENYRDWLVQRNSLSSGRAVFWTWIQNHVPDWYIENVVGQQDADNFVDPIGPQPEQVRLLAYISIACGCRGLGFWSDRFLAETHHGQGRLQGMAILNAELKMLAPVLLAQLDRPQWLKTSNNDVKAVLLRGSNGSLLLPIWMGKGSQYVPDQGAVASLTVTVPLVADGADPWRISPAGVECLRNNARKVTGGTELTIPEFDLVTPIVFTNDNTKDGLLVQWQDYNRRYGRSAAKWAMDLAEEERKKTYAVHTRLVQMGVQVRDADRLFMQSVKFHEDARRNFSAELYQQAFADSQRALRPLRVIMRDHWNQATATLDVPTASPYAVSFYSLPKHWELFREVQACQPGNTMLPGGSFDPGVKEIPTAGIPADAIPGWTARFGTLDRVDVAAGVVSSAHLEDQIPPRKSLDMAPKLFTASRPIKPRGEGYVPPAPELGRGVMKLEVRRRSDIAPDGKPVEQSARPLERTFLAVESPAVRLPPDTLVRVSGWIKIHNEITHTADGVLFYDDAGGEPLAVRLLETQGIWKQFHLYRRVPPSGQISLTMALTGIGVAYFDDLRVEPLIPTTQAAGTARKARGQRP